MWETFRGDEWSYSSASIEAVGMLSLCSDPATFTVSLNRLGSRRAKARELFNFLKRTREQLSEFDLICSVDNITEPLLMELADEGLVRLELIHYPYSRDARIEFL